MTVRHADKDDIVNGIKVPAGTSIFIAPGVTNFDPDSWGPDVASFNPDRWDKLPETISNYSFLTFLQGTETPFILRFLCRLSLYPFVFCILTLCILPLCILTLCILVS
jgi:Cytochrome P450